MNLQLHILLNCGEYIVSEFFECVPGHSQTDIMTSMTETILNDNEALIFNDVRGFTSLVKTKNIEAIKFDFQE
jgi:hypothetical protein